MARVAVRGRGLEVHADLRRELPRQADLRGSERVRLGRLREVVTVTLAAERRADVAHAEPACERLGDRIDRPGEQHDGVAAQRVLAQALHDRVIEARQQPRRDEFLRERRDVRAVEPAQVSLVLLDGDNPAGGQVAEHEQEECGDLPRALPAARGEVAPEHSFRAAAHQRAVDVEDRESHCLAPGRRRISCLCA